METIFHPETMAASPPSDRFARNQTSLAQSSSERARLRRLQIRSLSGGFESVEDLRRFFGADAGDIISIRWLVCQLDLLMVQRALAQLLGGWRVVEERRYLAHGHENLPQRMAIETAPGKFDFVLEIGRQFWQGPEAGDQIVTDLYVDDERADESSQITFSLPGRRHDWLATLLERVRQKLDKEHFLRGQAFDAKGNFLRSEETPDWDDVILRPELRAALQRNVLDLLRLRDLYKANGIPLKRGIILHGPPGTGKTLIGRVLARTAGVTFILATPGMLEEPEHIRRVFQWARRWAPTILFFEDFDMVARGRWSGGSSEELGEFLSCLDGVDAHDGVITIATTNDLSAIEPALRDRPNRFDCILEAPAMEREQCHAYLERWVQKRPAEIDLERWAGETRRLTGAQLQEVCRLAVAETIEDHLAKPEASAAEAIALTVKDCHMERALAKMKIKPKRRAGFNRD